MNAIYQSNTFPQYLERMRERESEVRAVTSEHWILRERETRWVGLG